MVNPVSSKCIMLKRTVKKLDQTVWRWGNSGSSSIASATSSASSAKSDLTPKPAVVSGLSKIKGSVSQLSNGADHSAIIVDNKLLTFGSNKYGQLGRSLASPQSDFDPTPAEVPFASPAVSVSCGNWHSVSLHADGSLNAFGWGGSFFSGAGALGLGTKDARRSPTLIEFFAGAQDRVIQVSCGNQHTLFLTESGSVFATGQGAYGILGTGEANDELFPVEISALTQCMVENEKVVKISCGGNFSAIVTNMGNLYVWGRNDSGQLGLGEESQGDMHSAERYPRTIPFFESERIFITDVACGENHIVALAQNGAMYYWGDRTWLEPHVVSLPEANGGIRGITKIAAGSKFSYALTDVGLVYAWGAKNSNCLIVDNLKRSPIAPIAIPPSAFGNQKVLDIAAGRSRCTAVTTDKELLVTDEAEANRLRDELGESTPTTTVTGAV